MIAYVMEILISSLAMAMRLLYDHMQWSLLLRTKEEKQFPF